MLDSLLFCVPMYNEITEDLVHEYMAFQIFYMPLVLSVMIHQNFHPPKFFMCGS